MNPVAKHAHKFNKSHIMRDRKKESRSDPFLSDCCYCLHFENRCVTMCRNCVDYDLFERKG